MFTIPEIIIVPHDEPVLLHGDNFIAYYATVRLGPAAIGSGNTEAAAVADLINRYPRGSVAQAAE